MDILALICIAAAILLLVVLSAIDLKHLILPDELNAALGACGVAFHVLTAYWYCDIQDMLLGAAIGGGMLYGIRFFANRHYGRDTLGLGDVKLLIAAGLWLGPEVVTQAITLGAAAGLVHGLVYAAILSHKNKTRFSISNLSIPAGPGFAVGIVIAGAIMYHAFIMEVLNEILA
jgi:prepilin signal peptidase PulO-like enzyme (type II secretory pathway)